MTSNPPAWPRLIAVLLALVSCPMMHAASAPADVSGGARERPRIYQLFVRQFGNTNETRKPNGTLAENGVGKFADVNDSALRSLRDLGITHVWLLGILRQATATDYSGIGLPADDPDLLKGLAGSPFAVRDCFDVCPDYAEVPLRRMEEFRALVGRVHNHGLKVIIDFVPNHVARSYRSVVRPELNFGARDDRTRFFAPQNNFFYLDGQPPVRLPTVKDGRPVSPTCQVHGGCDGLFDGELDHGKVTGNNVVSWTPDIGDWYETVKLNYGFDFRLGRNAPKEYPTAADPQKPIPDTWVKMDAVLAHWQGIGVDGFRCDMAHWIPQEFWKWAIGRARERNRSVLFVAEAYDDDPNKLTEGNVLSALVLSGFDAVYDHQSYRVLKDLYDGQKWANDLDVVLGSVAPLHASVRYAENHDEVRLASPGHWGGVGCRAGRAVSALLYALGRGPVLIYNGQEIGEPAVGAEGFGGDDGRTSIFDYWSMPELVKWVNGHQYDAGRLSGEQKALRVWYSRLLKLSNEPAFRRGDFIPLNSFNRENPAFGRSPEEKASGHWVYAFLRHEAASGQIFVVVVNLHRSRALQNLRIWLSPNACNVLGAAAGNADFEFKDLLASGKGALINTDASALRKTGLVVPAVDPLTACYFEVGRTK